MLSYWKGPSHPLRSDTTYEAFTKAVQRFPGLLALISRPDGIRWTYQELFEQVEKTARGLAGLGLRAGDRVGIWAGSCPEWILLQYGCARAGIVLVNVNPAYRANDLGYVIRKSRMLAIFHHACDARADYAKILAEVRSERDLPMRHAIQLGTEAWPAMIAGGVDLPPAPVDSNAVANIQYTSGTTGNPKGVLLTHHNLVNNADAIARGLDFTEEDRACLTFPLYHCAGYTCTSLANLITGSTLVISSRFFDAAATLQAIAEERVTLLYGVPSMFIAELEHPEFHRFDVASIRAMVIGGSPCPIELMRRMAECFRTDQIFDIYGQTEASPVITMSTKDDSLEVRTSTIGRAMENVEVKITDPVSGETLPVGEQGELCARGYLVMQGYDQDPEATRKTVDAEGWLHTGDLAVMRPDGHLNITGRAKDMIIRGGENIFPREIENLLHTHAKIADVQVVGAPDLKLGEAVACWIRLKAHETATEEEIREFCLGKIAHFKIPHYIRFVDSYPMTISGKVQKFHIRQMEIEMRGLQQAAQIPTA
jgi:fatty-acyl-CoA synthase